MSQPTKYELQTLAKCWEYFASQVIPPGASAASVRRAQMCFYAGAAFLTDQAIAIGEPGVTEAAGVAHLEGLQQELRDYREELGRQVAELRLISRRRQAYKTKLARRATQSRRAYETP